MHRRNYQISQLQSELKRKLNSFVGMACSDRLAVVEYLTLIVSPILAGLDAWN